MEEERNNSIKFLDIRVDNKEVMMQTSWHLKETNTGVYIPRRAYCPLSCKKSAIRSLIYRAYKISNYLLYEVSYKKIESMFIDNGYHPAFIRKIRQDVVR